MIEKKVVIHRHRVQRPVSNHDLDENVRSTRNFGDELPTSDLRMEADSSRSHPLSTYELNQSRESDQTHSQVPPAGGNRHLDDFIMATTRALHLFDERIQAVEDALERHDANLSARLSVLETRLSTLQCSIDSSSRSSKLSSLSSTESFSTKTLDGRDSKERFTVGSVIEHPDEDNRKSRRSDSRLENFRVERFIHSIERRFTETEQMLSRLNHSSSHSVSKESER